jgi:hypothetical protein
VSTYTSTQEINLLRINFYHDAFIRISALVRHRWKYRNYYLGRD